MRYLYIRCISPFGYDDSVAQGYGDESQPLLIGGFWSSVGDRSINVLTQR